MAEQLSWQELSNRFSPEVVLLVKNRIFSGDSKEITLKGFGDLGSNREHVENLLKHLVDVDVLKIRNVNSCPECDGSLTEDEIQDFICLSCNYDFLEEDSAPVNKTIYISEVPLNRPVPWLIAVHGMNTSGSWQEDFSWKIANKFYYRAPVLIYKYGIINLEILFRKRHEKLVKELGQKIRLAMAQAKANNLCEPPDIILHSFGSLLFAKLLLKSEFSDLRFGRAIITGSIIRPDFEWSRFADRIELVFNHYSSGDRLVSIAQLVVPDSGPSGRYGFVDSVVLNIQENEYGHSSYFMNENLDKNLEKNGKWDLMLRYPLPTIRELLLPKIFPQWKPIPFIVQKLTNTIMILLLPVFVIMLILFAVLKEFRRIFLA